jgi:hypothetical protein
VTKDPEAPPLLMAMTGPSDPIRSNYRLRPLR